VCQHPREDTAPLGIERIVVLSQFPSRLEKTVFSMQRRENVAKLFGKDLEKAHKRRSVSPAPTAS